MSKFNEQMAKIPEDVVNLETAHRAEIDRELRALCVKRGEVPMRWMEVGEEMEQSLQPRNFHPSVKPQ